MNRITDERISSWLDGALAPADAAEVEAAVAADPALAARVEAWRENDRRLAEAFAPFASAPLEPELLDRLGLSEASALRAANDNRPWWQRHMMPLGGALAASLALVAVLFGPGGRETGDGGLSVALETTPSLGRERLADGRTVQPLLTVRAANGHYCREFRLGDGGGLACRDADTWKVVAKAQVAAFPDPGAYAAAGGAADAGLAEAYSRIGAGDPLDRDAEAALIERRWADR